MQLAINCFSQCRRFVDQFRFWLWHAVAEATGLKAERTLFIDDSEAILDAAAQFGIRYCLGVTNPDSGIAEKQYQRHPSLNDYRRLIPSLM